MKPPPVHILVTIRKPDLLPAAMMVFKSIRVGFPTAHINVYWNGWDCGSNMHLLLPRFLLCIAHGSMDRHGQGSDQIL